MTNFTIFWIILPAILLVVGFVILRSHLRRMYPSYEDFEIAMKLKADRKKVKRLERAEMKAKKQRDEYCLWLLENKNKGR